MRAWAFHGWRVVAACFVIAAVTWSLGLFGASVYLQAVTAEHGWAISTVASAITVFYLTSAALQRTVAGQIERRGPRPVLAVGALHAHSRTDGDNGALRGRCFQLFRGHRLCRRLCGRLRRCRLGPAGPLLGLSRSLRRHPDGLAY